MKGSCLSQEDNIVFGYYCCYCCFRNECHTTHNIFVRVLSFIHIILGVRRYHCSTSSNAYAALNQLYSDDIMPSFPYVLYLYHTLIHTRVWCTQGKASKATRADIACWLACSAHSKAHIAHSRIWYVSSVYRAYITNSRSSIYTRKIFVNLAFILYSSTHKTTHLKAAAAANTLYNNITKIFIQQEFDSTTLQYCTYFCQANISSVLTLLVDI